MPITPANISIDQFQKISSGRYNAGEVKLSDTGSLTKVNNHVHLRGKNVVAVTHEETLAVKEAFVRALANSGVGTDALNAVRRELGLLPDGSKDKTLAEGKTKVIENGHNGYVVQTYRVIVDSKGMPDQQTLLEAATLAVHFSSQRNGVSVPVDYVPRRYVKKPSGSKPGFVIFTNQRTVLITPDPNLIATLKKGIQESKI